MSNIKESITAGLLVAAVMQGLWNGRALQEIQRKLDKPPPVVATTVTPCPLAYYPVIQMKDDWQQDMITTMPFDLMTTFTMTPCDGGLK